MPTVYGVTLSLYTRKLRAFLAEKAISYNLDVVVPGDSSPEYRAISPLGKVPAYRDQDVTLADSSVISAYIERIHPEPRLYPADPCAYGRALWFEEYGDTALAAVAGPIVYNRIIGPRFLGLPADTAAVEKAMAAMPRVLDYLESQLEGEYLVGESLSIADIAVVTSFVHLRHVDIAPDPKRWPKLRGFAERVASRPSFQMLFDEERAMLTA